MGYFSKLGQTQNAGNNYLKKSLKYYLSFSILTWMLVGPPSIVLGITMLSIFQKEFRQFLLSGPFIWCTFILLMVGLVRFFFRIGKTISSKAQKNQVDLEPTNIEVTELDQPLLFGFIKNISQELATKPPDKVFINGTSNAYVYINCQLFKENEKHLIIGLPLIKTLTQGELIAVLAHEIAHLRQKSTWISCFTALFKEVLEEKIAELEEEKKDHPRGNKHLTWMSLWFLKKWLGWLRKFHRWLNHSMEFNADMHAAQLAGKTQIINALRKIIQTKQVVQVTLKKIVEAADFEVFSDNIFYHIQAANSEYHIDIAPEKEYFQNWSGAKFQIWKSYLAPGDDHFYPLISVREQKLKKSPFEKVPNDEPGFQLIQNLESLERTISFKFYAQFNDALQLKNLCPAELAQDLVFPSLPHIAFAKSWQEINWFRLVNPYQIGELEQFDYSVYGDKKAIYQHFKALFQPYQIWFFEEWKSIQERLIRFSNANESGRYAYLEGTYFDSLTWQKAKVDCLQSLEDLNNQFFIPFDQEVFFIHLTMAQFGPNEIKEKYLRHCSYHNDVYEAITCLDNIQERFSSIMTEQQNLDSKTFQSKKISFIQSLADCLEDLVALQAYLTSLDWTPFKHASLSQRVFGHSLDHLSSPSLKTAWTKAFKETLERSISNCRQIYQVNFAFISKAQKEIFNDFERQLNLD